MTMQAAHAGVGLAVGGAVLAVVAVVVVVVNVLVRRAGYAIPGRTAVRCSKGHRFTTTWIEGGSLEAVRLGPLTRFQRCPVGHHWAIVHPVRWDEARVGGGADEDETGR